MVVSVMSAGAVVVRVCRHPRRRGPNFLEYFLERFDLHVSGIKSAILFFFYFSVIRVKGDEESKHFNGCFAMGISSCPK